MSLSPDEIDRYARHIVLRDIGGPGQGRLKTARVLLIGAGGLGAPVIQYLAAAGIGTLGIADDDRVALSDLQRQVLFSTADVGALKAERAAAQVRALNPHVTPRTHTLRVTADNAAALVAGYDLVVDGSDNFATRYAVADACLAERRPLVTGAVGSFDGSVTTLRPFDTDTQGRPNPTYRCLFPTPPPDGSMPTCAEAGVVGALTGIVGSMMALEVVRQIVGFGDDLVGRLLLVDARAWRFDIIHYGRDPANPPTDAPG